MRYTLECATRVFFKRNGPFQYPLVAASNLSTWRCTSAPLPYSKPSDSGRLWERWPQSAMQVRPAIANAESPFCPLLELAVASTHYTCWREYLGVFKDGWVQRNSNFGSSDNRLEWFLFYFIRPLIATLLRVSYRITGLHSLIPGVYMFA